MYRTNLLATVAIASLALPAAAFAAQDPPGENTLPTNTTPSRTTSYDAAYFAQFAPRTALDIVNRVPGFTLDVGNNNNNGGDVRGFAGVAGNVVINGARPSSKAESLDTTLARIPAQRVVKVELGPGDVYGSDYAGKSQVLNIVLSAEGGLDANVSASAARRYTGYINTDIQGSVLYRRGPSSFNLSAGTGRNKQDEEGTDTVIDTATGDLVEFRRKHNSYFNRDPFIAGSWAMENGATKAIRLNARWQPSRFDLTQRNRVTPDVGPQHDDSLFQHYRRPVIELGGDITRPLADGAIKLVGLTTRRKRDDVDTYLARDALLDEGGTVVGGSEYRINAKRDETIGRLSWTRANLWGMSTEFGAEAALNTLDSKVAYSIFDETGTEIPIPLPLDDAKVEEKRGEVYVRLGKTFSPALRVDAGMNFEWSHLTVTGDTTADRKLKFLKPNLSIDWKPGGDWRTRLSLRRTVAQLDFYDFISVAELSTDRVNAGNQNLQPQRSWEARFTAEHSLLGDGLFKLELGHDRVSLLQDRILICDEDDVDACFDAPGNIGTGKRWFATLDVDAPLSVLWKGLRFRGRLTLQRTRVEDPINGEQRKWSGYYPAWDWFMEVRRDSGDWSYGMAVNDYQRFTYYRTDEYDTSFNGGLYGTAFVEYRLSPKTAVRLDVDNLLDTSGNRDRLLFDPNRLAPKFIYDELRERNRHLSFQITLKQSFGGSGGVAKAN